MKKFLIGSIILSCMLIFVGINLVAYEKPEQAPTMAALSCPEITGAVLAQVLNLLTQTGSSRDYNQGMAIRASLTSPSHNFLMKRIMPTWGRVNLLKRTASQNFFFPTLTLLMFFIFYQASRTASESDPH
ncbi:MAG TPA: hypothetical protein VHY08_22710 [Bacillota bacterium]|nr:hypothetical protein [Bacillota bacterium]